MLKPAAATVAQTVSKRVSEVLETPKKADSGFEDRVATQILTELGLRIKGINKTTRDLIAGLISDGFADGLSPAEVADTIEGSTAFSELRAETIARTETMFAYNAAALGTYGEFGVDRVEAIDGDEDEVCATRDGQTYSVEEAFGIEDHPNGTLDWAPSFGKSTTPAVIASPVAVAPPSPAGLDIPTLISAIVAAVKPEKPEPVVVNFTERELPRSRTIIDRDVETGRIIGTHEEYVGAS